jgi:hypothetical protein
LLVEAGLRGNHEPRSYGPSLNSANLGIEA